MDVIPFPLGSRIQLRDENGRDLTFTVERAFEPFTRSQVVLARCAALSSSPVVIKIYDPRYFHERTSQIHNNDVKDRPWSLKAEAASMADTTPLVWGSGYLVPDELERDEPTEARDIEYRAARWEKHFQARMREIYETELEAYRRLRPLWGSAVPTLITHGVYLPSEKRHIQLLVIVLEYIDGITLESAPPETIQPETIAQLSDTVRLLPRYNVLHNDYNPRNIILAPQRAVLIDFGESVLRETGESQEEWDAHVRSVGEWPGEVVHLLKRKRMAWREEFGVPAYDLPAHGGKIL